MGKMSSLSLAVIMGAMGAQFDNMRFIAYSTPQRGYYHFSTGKQNQRRKRKTMRQTVFANRHIARGF